MAPKWHGRKRYRHDASRRYEADPWSTVKNEDGKEDSSAVAVFLHMPCTDCANLSPGSYRVVRGASFANAAANLRASFRIDFFTPQPRNSNIGFRCARTPRTQTSDARVLASPSRSSS